MACKLPLLFLVILFVWTPGFGQNLDRETISFSIQDLTPEYGESVVYPLNFELLGFGFVGDGKSFPKGHVSVQKGQVYQLVLYYKFLEHIPDLQKKVTLFLGTLPIKETHFQRQQVQVGAVEKQVIPIRIPLMVADGPLALKVSYDSFGDTVIGQLAVLDVQGDDKSDRAAYVTDTRNMLKNGSFENGEQNWVSYEPFPVGVSKALDEKVAFDGNASFRLDFSGATNAEVWRILYQTVPVKPNTSYVLQYHLKTDGIDTPCGVKLEVADADQMQSFIIGVDQFLTGTQDWQPMTYRFKTPDFTNALMVRVRRYPCGITAGSAWFDNIVLKEMVP